MRSAASGLTKAVLAGLIAVVLITDAAIVGVRLGDDDSRGGADPSKEEVSALQATLPELIAFVEQARGLKFKQPPKVELLADEKFEQMLMEGEEDGADPAGDPAAEYEEAYAGLLRAFGIIGNDVDFDAVFDEQVDSTVGFYDTRTQTLYARGAEPSPYVKMVLVHELTHALDDQHFGIDRGFDDDEADAAFTALVEGSATIVERKWIESRSEDEQEAIEDQENRAGLGAGGDSPEVFLELFAFPYIVGPDFVQALLDAGGQARLDAAFTDPPTTTEQVIHPERFLGGEGVRSVASPRADGEVIDEGTNGELGLIVILDSAIDRDAALRAAAGWGGDEYVAWTAGNRTCFRWNLVMDTTRDTNEAVAALRSWAAANPGATVRGTNPIVVANCA